MKEALSALEVEKYAAALKEYDSALYEAVRGAGEAALAKILDEAQDFSENDLRLICHV